MAVYNDGHPLHSEILETQPHLFTHPLLLQTGGLLTNILSFSSHHDAHNHAQVSKQFTRTIRTVHQRENIPLCDDTRKLFDIIEEIQESQLIQLDEHRYQGLKEEIHPLLTNLRTTPQVVEPLARMALLIKKIVPLFISCSSHLSLEEQMHYSNRFVQECSLPTFARSFQRALAEQLRKTELRHEELEKFSSTIYTLLSDEELDMRQVIFLIGTIPDRYNRIDIINLTLQAIKSRPYELTINELEEILHIISDEHCPIVKMNCYDQLFNLCNLSNINLLHSRELFKILTIANYVKENLDSWNMNASDIRAIIRTFEKENALPALLKFWKKMNLSSREQLAPMMAPFYAKAGLVDQAALLIQTMGSLEKGMYIAESLEALLGDPAKMKEFIACIESSITCDEKGYQTFCEFILQRKQGELLTEENYEQLQSLGKTLWHTP